LASVRKARGKWTVAGWMGWLYDGSAFEVCRRWFDLEGEGKTNLFSPNLPRPTTSKHLFTRLDMLRLFIVYLQVAGDFGFLCDIVKLGA
jgi:hypothetical protein